MNRMLSSQINKKSFSNRLTAIRKRSSPNRRLSSHSYYRESVTFSYFWDDYFLSYGEFAMFVDNGALRLSPLYYDTGQQVAHSSRPHAESIILID